MKQTDGWTEIQTDEWNRQMDGEIQTDESWIIGWTEGNVLFNDALNTFYLRSYGVNRLLDGEFPGCQLKVKN